MHDVHDEHGLLVYASDYLILTYYCFWVECREQVRRVLVPFLCADPCRGNMPHGPRGGEGKMALPCSVVSENQMSGK